MQDPFCWHTVVQKQIMQGQGRPHRQCRGACGLLGSRSRQPAAPARPDRDLQVSERVGAQGATQLCANGYNMAPPPKRHYLVPRSKSDRAWTPAKIAMPGCSVAAAHKPLSEAIPSTALDAAKKTTCAGSMVILHRQHGDETCQRGHNHRSTSVCAAWRTHGIGANRNRH